MKIITKKITTLLANVSILLLLSGCAIFTPKDPFKGIRLNDEREERSWKNTKKKYTELLKTYGETQCNGAVAVATDTEIVYFYCENAVEKDGTTLVSQYTKFDLASISKTMTAVSILQLAEKGKLSINDTLSKYFPEYKIGANITIYQLLHMLTGIPDYLNNPDPFWGISGAEAADKKIADILQDRVTEEQFLAALYQAPLGFEPGTKYEYSNSNYRLLAFIIEQVSGMKYCDYVQKNIFNKCGMIHTTSMAKGDLTYVPVNFEEEVEYEFTDKDGYPVCPINTKGDGGIHSCLSDLILFDRALFGGKLLNKDSMKTLLSAENGYCCGLMLNNNGYSHDGSSITCAGFNKIVESEEFGHVYVITLWRTGIEDESNRSANIMTGTCYTKGIYENYTYTNEYAGLHLEFPKDHYPMPQNNVEQAHYNAIGDMPEDRDKSIERATNWEKVIMNLDGDFIQINYINTKLAVPDDTCFTEDEYFDWTEDAGWLAFWYTKPEFFDDRVWVNICGKEYLRLHFLLDINGDIGDYYIYARKLDDNLMCTIEVHLLYPHGMTIEDYEKIFS